MYPFIEPFSGVLIYTFGIAMTICFFMFVWMLKKLSVKIGFDFLIFKKNLLWYFIGIFFFSRLFYVISRWNDLKHIENPIEFFIMNDYHFSLTGAIFGFMVVFYILLRIRKEKLDNFITGLVLSLLFILPIGYIGALLGGQVYGRETFIGLEIMYNHPFTPVPYKVPVFPLPIVYSVLFFILFSVLYIVSMYVNYNKIIGYIGLMLTTCIIFIFEFFSGKYGVFKDLIGINFTQVGAIILFLFCVKRLFNIYREDSKEKIVLKN